VRSNECLPSNEARTLEGKPLPSPPTHYETRASCFLISSTERAVRFEAYPIYPYRICPPTPSSRGSSFLPELARADLLLLLPLSHPFLLHPKRDSGREGETHRLSRTSLVYGTALCSRCYDLEERKADERQEEEANSLRRSSTWRGGERVGEVLVCRIWVYREGTAC